MAFWTLGYQFVLIARWPAKTVIWCFLTIAIIGFFLLGRLWKKSGAVPGKGYEFHSSHLFRSERPMAGKNRNMVFSHHRHYRIFFAGAFVEKERRRPRQRL